MAEEYGPYEHPRWKDNPTFEKTGIKAENVDKKKKKSFEEMKKKAVKNFKAK
ncbi:hypothetical protein NIE88_22085 [Sporolactobacillus shoreicorticis]|uniref:Uncharacterized protein n=1 Tax=Sporolactobacillus shoreicorticis TaxID=1923877 RepID=A0ABW5SB40_9BACL|nr:hypothetical protein [Sporolactobacillus shoreicorticis]MCO7128415.1 hypothetical protein [Sporolactobacillus shoreicorticis]